MKDDGQSPEAARLEKALDYIREALRGLRFGQITIAIQDGAIVQMERTERKRFDRKGS